MFQIESRINRKNVKLNEKNRSQEENRENGKMEYESIAKYFYYIHYFYVELYPSHYE